jgi:hypothetical protein
MLVAGTIMFFIVTVGLATGDEGVPLSPGPAVVAFADLKDLGIPYERDFRVPIHHYARNPWSLFAFDGLLFIGGGDGSLPMGQPSPGPFRPKVVDLSNDGILELNLVDEEELNAFRVIDGQLVVPGIDPAQTTDASLHLLQERLLIPYLVAENRNHLYDVYRSRRNGRYFSATGHVGGARDPVVSSSDSLKFGWTSDSSALTSWGSRGMAFLEFGAPGGERLFCVQWARVYDVGTEDTPTGQGAWLNYEYNFETMQWEGVTNAIWSGLDPRFTGPAVGPDSSGRMVAVGDVFVPWKVTRVDDDTYMAVFGRRRMSNRFGFPGLAIGFDDGTGKPDNVTGSGSGGVYGITLGSKKPVEWARGETFFDCERVLDSELGRQWDFQLVDEDVYVLTETPDQMIHVYRNGVEVLRVPDAPTFARSFAVVGESVYLGLGSERTDPYRHNGSQLSLDCGRIVKAEGVLGEARFGK